MKIWTKLQTWKNFIFILWTFFENFKYFQVCVYWMKRLIKIFFKEILYTTMTRNFFEINQKKDKYIIQKAKSIFIFKFNIIQNRVILYYWQMFFYIMRHLRELLSNFTKLKLKSNKRKIRTTKNFNKFILYKLIDLTKRLKFKSKKINDLKTKNFNYINKRSSFEQSKPAYVINKFKKCQKKNVYVSLTWRLNKTRIFFLITCITSTKIKKAVFNSFS